KTFRSLQAMGIHAYGLSARCAVGSICALWRMALCQAHDLLRRSPALLHRVRSIRQREDRILEHGEKKGIAFGTPHSLCARSLFRTIEILEAIRETFADFAFHKTGPSGKTSTDLRRERLGCR